MEKISKRIYEIVSLIEKAEVINDVGCDHGYVSYLALKNCLCEKVVISDISKKSLNKAIKLLSGYKKDKVLSAVCFGICQDIQVDEAIICGMGGEEIVKIISSAKNLPQVLVLNPMKNSKKVRELLIDKGYGLKRDYMFFDEGKYYELMLAIKGYEQERYTAIELEYGRENLKDNATFLNYIEEKINRLSSYSSGSTANEKIEKLRGVQHEIRKNLSNN